jgi:hypothetical protein
LIISGEHRKFLFTRFTSEKRLRSKKSARILQKGIDPPARFDRFFLPPRYVVVMVQFETSVLPVAFGRNSGGLIRRKFVSGIIRWSGIRGLKTMKSGSGWSVGG